jgi:tRNA (guanosine-2'-O-)-methyltransferase
VSLHTLAHIGTHWHTLAHIGTHWHTLAHIGTHWHTLAHIGTHWHTLAHIGTHWHTLAHIGIHIIYLDIDWIYILSHDPPSAVEIPSPVSLRMSSFRVSTRRLRLDSRQLHALPRYKIARKEFPGSEEFSGDVQERAARLSQFPWQNAFELSRSSDSIYSADQIISSLEPIISQERISRIESVIESRCFDVLPLIEHPHDWGNVSAVCRSADALGMGALHIIRDKSNEKYKQSARTSGGADKWLDIQLHDCDSKSGEGTRAVLNSLRRDRGMQIVSTALGTETKRAKHPSEIDWTVPTVVVFGNELEGVSQAVLDESDEICEIPIDGFVESFNVSVAASLIFWEARRVRIEKLGRHGDLRDFEKEILKAVFYLRNKGQFVSYASQLLEREPPKWQRDRKLDWGDKSFSMDEYVDDKYVRKLKAKAVRCHLWDGKQCLGEKYLYKEGRPCRYARAHVPGKSTLDVEKLRAQAERYQVGHKIPELLQTLAETRVN